MTHVSILFQLAIIKYLPWENGLLFFFVCRLKKAFLTNSLSNTFISKSLLHENDLVRRHTIAICDVCCPSTSATSGVKFFPLWRNRYLNSRLTKNINACETPPKQPWKMLSTKLILVIFFKVLLNFLTNTVHEKYDAWTNLHTPSSIQCRCVLTVMLRI